MRVNERAIKRRRQQLSGLVVECSSVESDDESVGDVSAGGLRSPHDLHNLTALEAEVSRDRV